MTAPPRKATPRRAATPAEERRPRPPVITSLDDFEENVNILLFGDPGAGKTPLACTADLALLVALEKDGPVSAKRWGSKAKVTVCNDFPDLHRTFVWLRDVAVPAKQFKTVIIDSAPKMQELALRYIMDKAHKDNPKQDPDVPSQREHQKWQYTFKKYVNNINDLAVNVIWTAHTMRAEVEDDELETSRLVLPLLSGKNGTADPKTMSMWMSGTVGLLGYLGIDEENVPKAPHRRLVINRSGDYEDFIVRDRFELGVPYIDNPNMSTLIKQIENSGARAAGTTRTRRGQ